MYLLKSRCQEAYTLGTRGQPRGKQQDGIWHGCQRTSAKKLAAPEQQLCGVPSWLWHQAGSQRQKKAKDGGIEEDGKTRGGMRTRGKCREVTA